MINFFFQYNFIEHTHVQLAFAKKQSARKRKLQLEAGKT